MDEKGIINFSDWQKIDLRIGKIIEVDEVEGADKLYKISIDLGEKIGKRTLVAGLKPYYSKEDLKKKQCVVFTNLEPKKIRGIESQGMLLAASGEDDTKVCLLQPDKEIKEGSLIK